MSLILKSENALEISSFLDVLDAALNPVLNIDAVNAKYTIKSEEFEDLNSIMTANHYRIGYYDTNYNYKLIEEDGVVVVSNHPLSYKRGILVEGESGNAFLDATNPKTQVVNLAVIGSKRIVRFRVCGEGSIRVTNNTTQQFIKEVIEGNDLYIEIDATSESNEKSYLVEVVGNPSFVEVYYNNSSRYIITKTDTPSGRAEGSIATALNLKNTLSDLVTNNRGCLFLKISLSPEMVFRPSISMLYYILKIGNENSGISIGLKDVDGMARAVLNVESDSSSKQTIESAMQINSRDCESINFALKFSESIVTLFCNGHNVGSISTALDMSNYKVFFGNIPKWSVHLPHIIEQLVILDEQLTENELEAMISI